MGTLQVAAKFEAKKILPVGEAQTGIMMQHKGTITK
jgi:hypothetical protein